MLVPPSTSTSTGHFPCTGTTGAFYPFPLFLPLPVARYLSCLDLTVPSYPIPLQTVAAYFRLHWVIINKLQGKAVTHAEKLEWWIILMVDCVTILLHFSTIRFPTVYR